MDPLFFRCAGFDWDEANRAKSEKHGVSREEIEQLFAGTLAIRSDDRHSDAETRYIAIGRTRGRHVLLAFTVRIKEGERRIRPISARYMHRKEVRHYEKENPDLLE